jgi:SAM-dependent methyltransferase
MSYLSDLEQTRINRKRLRKNRNLLFWYQELFSQQFGNRSISSLRILEVGSGTSPLKKFYPNVITSDVLDLDYLDLVFDCHEIDREESIPDGSLDIVVMTNVLHHLKEPIHFLLNARRKLNEEGAIIITEPFFSLFSSLLFKYLHHEAVDKTIDYPRLSDTNNGPLSTANIALPYLIFYGNKGWLECLEDIYQIRTIGYFSSISYFLTGGISRRFPIAFWIYRILYKLDMLIARLLPKIAASFFTVILVKKPEA